MRIYPITTRLIETENALNENKTPDISEFPNSPIKNNVIKDSSEISETISLNPNQINVEAKKFQFKESDELGVTDRLQGVKKWDNYQAGLVSVYKYSDGTFSIADGHQRLALAKRLMKEDPGQDIKLNAYVLVVLAVFTLKDTLLPSPRNFSHLSTKSFQHTEAVNACPPFLSFHSFKTVRNCIYDMPNICWDIFLSRYFTEG